ncbi:STAS domain-containing protein [Jatrophihabitans sp. YIM 134969]
MTHPEPSSPPAPARSEIVRDDGSTLAPGQIEVTTRVDGATTTIHVRGTLLQETAARFTDVATPVGEDATVTHVVVDLSGTAFMDSTGLGTLVTLRNTMLGRGGRLAVIRPDDRVFRLFELTRLDTVFEFVDAE